MKKYKKYYIAAGVVAVIIVIGLITYFVVSNKKSELSITFQDTKVIEYGDKKVTSKSLIKASKGDSIKYPKLDVMQVGKQKLVYTVKDSSDEKEFTYEIEVKDTKKPVIKIKENQVTMQQGDTYTLTDNVESVKDPVDGDIVYAETAGKGRYVLTSTFDASKAGEYEVVIVAKDKNGNTSTASFKIVVEEKKEAEKPESETDAAQTQNQTPSSTQPTYINGVLLVNKNHPVSRAFGGNDATASAALGQLQAGADAAGYVMPLLSGYRSYDYQASLYNNYVAIDGQAAADRYSARPGMSEHQTGLAFDIGQLDNNYGNTPAGQWLAQHVHEYGFIIRYPQGKEHITGYMYEPWHVRYLGVDVATSVVNSNLTLEEYLGTN